MIIETVQLFIFLLERFSSLIEKVATGEIGLTAALATLQAED
ncbi:MAG: hypothetical protein M5U34_04740 [Chloroflexi bacterium]|nr:hypothetical protein [Chloroflexota bacterium]